MKLLKLPAPTSRVQPIAIVLWIAAVSVIGGGIIKGFEYARSSAATATSTAQVDTNTPEYRVNAAYSDLQQVSSQVRSELVKQRALGILQTANQQQQPIVWLREKAIANESALKAELNRNLLFAPADLERINKLLLDSDAFALLMNLLTSNEQSSLTPKLDLMELSRQVEGMRSLWDTEFIERRFPNE